VFDVGEGVATAPSPCTENDGTASVVVTVSVNPPAASTTVHAATPSAMAQFSSIAMPKLGSTYERPRVEGPRTRVAGASSPDAPEGSNQVVAPSGPTPSSCADCLATTAALTAW